MKDSNVKTELKAGVKLFLTAGGIILGVALIIASVFIIEGCAEYWEQHPKTIQAKSYDETFIFSLKTDMRVYVPYNPSNNLDNGIHFLLANDQDIDDYFNAVKEAKYDASMLDPTLIFISTTHDNYEYSFIIIEYSRGYDFIDVPFYCPIQLVMEPVKMFKDLNQINDLEETLTYTTAYSYEDFKNYFENLNFAHISYAEDEGKIIYDDWLQFVISDDTLTISQVES